MVACWLRELAESGLGKADGRSGIYYLGVITGNGVLNRKNEGRKLNFLSSAATMWS